MTPQQTAKILYFIAGVGTGVAALFVVAALSGSKLDPITVDKYFISCMEQAEKSSVIGRVMSPTDECMAYAERQARRH